MAGSSRNTAPKDEPQAGLQLDEGALQEDNEQPVQEQPQATTAQVAIANMQEQAQQLADQGYVEHAAFPGTPPAVQAQRDAQQQAIIDGTVQQSTESWRPNLLAGGQQAPAMVMSSNDYRQQLAAQTNAEARAMHKTFSTTVPGGRYLIDGQYFNANGDLLQDDEG